MPPTRRSVARTRLTRLPSPGRHRPCPAAPGCRPDWCAVSSAWAARRQTSSPPPLVRCTTCGHPHVESPAAARILDQGLLQGRRDRIWMRARGRPRIWGVCRTASGRVAGGLLVSGYVARSQVRGGRNRPLGSTHMGNVTYALPAIHPTIEIDCGEAVNHQPGFISACVTVSADRAVSDGALYMAWTAVVAAIDDEQRGRLISAVAARASQAVAGGAA